MSTEIETESRSWVVRFLDTFLQEQNIRWLLGMGMLILLGSSLMLVTSQWEAYSSAWRFFVLIGYTIGVHGAGQLVYHQLGLRKTGTGLMALTVLLIPVSFHALRWIRPEAVFSAETFWDHGLVWAALATNTAFCVLAAKRLFDHFLRRTQPIFIAAYVLLSLAGAIVPALPSGLAPLTALGLWSVFAVGAMQVNRHVFWMTEEHRLPRIFGFFPIALLSLQFLTVFALSLASHMTLPWIGVGTVMTAIPVLFAADEMAKVFQRVNGKLARPLPASIALPMFLGLTLSVVGVVLSATTFPDAKALVPAAGLAAVTMGLVARRTGHRVFVWAMLIGTALAYQSAPSFFRELVVHVLSSSAAAVHESRLPAAFYGLTYLPLLSVLTVIAHRGVRHNEEFFAPVLLKFVTVVGALLLGLAITHGKAMFPVGLALSGLFAWQAVCFRRRAFLRLGVVAWILMALGVMPFAEGVLLWTTPTELQPLIWAMAAGALLWPGRTLDRVAAKWQPVSFDSSANGRGLCEVVSLLAVVLTTLAWLMAASHATSLVIIGPSGALLVGLLLVHAAAQREFVLTVSAVSFAILCPCFCSVAIDWSLSATLTLAGALLSVVFLLTEGLRRRPASVGAQVFGESTDFVSRWGLTAASVLVVWPMSIATLALDVPFTLWPLAVLTTAWSCISALSGGVRGSRDLGILLFWISLSALVGVTAVTIGGIEMRVWLPTIWSVQAIGLMSLSPLWDRQSNVVVKAHGVSTDLWLGCISTTLGTVALLSLFVFTVPLRVAGCTALVGLLMLAARRQSPLLRQFALLIINWQVLSTTLQVCLPDATSLLSLTLERLIPAALPIAVVAAGQALLWQRAAYHSANGKGRGQAPQTSDLADENVSTKSTATSPNLKSAEPDPTLFDVVVRSANQHWLADRNETDDEHSWESKAAPNSAGTGVELADVVKTQRALLYLVTAGGLCLALLGMTASFTLFEASLATITIGLLIVDEVGLARRLQSEARVWSSEAILALGLIYLAIAGVITFGHGWSMYLVLATGLASWGLSRAASVSAEWKIAEQPLALTGSMLPAVVVVMGVARHMLIAAPEWRGMNSLALLFAAAFYFWRGLEQRLPSYVTSSAVVLNVALAMLWNELSWSDPQLFMIPLGLSVLGLVELLHRELPSKSVTPLRYVGALVILVSPTFHIVSGSWLHLFSLMAVSVAVTLLGMGCRIRALMYLGTGFLLADLLAMVVRGSVDHPSILWVAGIALGMLVITLAAYCERHRELLLQRIRLAAAELETWR